MPCCMFHRLWITTAEWDILFEHHHLFQVINRMLIPTAMGGVWRVDNGWMSEHNLWVHSSFIRRIAQNGANLTLGFLLGRSSKVFKLHYTEGLKGESLRLMERLLFSTLEMGKLTFTFKYNVFFFVKFELNLYLFIFKFE